MEDDEIDIGKKIKRWSWNFWNIHLMMSVSWMIICEKTLFFFRRIVKIISTVVACDLFDVCDKEIIHDPLKHPTLFRFWNMNIERMRRLHEELLDFTQKKNSKLIFLNFYKLRKRMVRQSWSTNNTQICLLNHFQEDDISSPGLCTLCVLSV